VPVRICKLAMASWGPAKSAQTGSASGRVSAADKLLEEFIDNRKLSIRAREDLKSSMRGAECSLSTRPAAMACSGTTHPTLNQDVRQY
jgi:hypothetical protein